MPPHYLNEMLSYLVFKAQSEKDAFKVAKSKAAAERKRQPRPRR